MNTASPSTLLILGVLACAPALAQEAPVWIGAAGCRLAAVKPTPAQPPSWNGGCKDGYAEGKGVLEWVDAKDKHYKLEAEFVAGRVRGEGTLYAPYGEVYTGTLTDGVPDGHGYFREQDGSQFEGEVRMGKLSGMAEALYANGDDYKGEWKDDRPDGTGTMTWILGGRYEGDWKNGKPSGAGKIVYAGGTGREVAVQDGREPGRERPPATDERYTLKHDYARTGTMLRSDAAREVPVPPTLSYKELSPKQQAEVARWYPALAPGDEPPYPARGLAEFYKAMSRVVSKTLQQGTITVYVLVGTDGKARSVRAVGLDDPETRKIVATVAGLIQYKPAVCAGQPCEMMYPYRTKMVLEP